MQRRLRALRIYAIFCGVIAGVFVALWVLNIGYRITDYRSPAGGVLRTHGWIRGSVLEHENIEGPILRNPMNFHPVPGVLWGTIPAFNHAPTRTFFVIADWLPAIPFIIVASIFSNRYWRLRMRAYRGCCAQCGYDLRVQRPGDRCPECGTVKTGEITRVER